MSSNNKQNINDHNHSNDSAAAGKVRIGAQISIVVLCGVFLLVVNGQDLMHSVQRLRLPQPTEEIEDSFSNSTTMRQEEQQEERVFSQQQHQQQTSPPRQPPPFPNATWMTPLYYPREPPFNVSQAELGNCIAYMDNNPPQHGVGPSNDFFRWYRLGDCIRRCKGCGGENAYNGTFANMYEAQACPEILNFTVLGDILRRKENMEGYPKPDPEAVIVHVRLGDVMENSIENITTMLAHGGTPFHAGDYKGAIRSVYQYMEDLHQAQATKVEIVGGSHTYYEGKSRSMTYAHCLHYALHSAGYQVTMRMGGVNPDQDFYYMANAKRIMLSSGGYSKLLGQVVVKSGGEIVGPVWVGEGFRYL